MSSIVTDIATPPPPPPPLEIERWRSVTKTMSTRGGFFTRQLSLERDYSYNFEKYRGGRFESSRFSRESSVVSDKSDSSIGSNFSTKSSTLTRLFSRRHKKSLRSVSTDSIATDTWKKSTVSTPTTPILTYGTWRRGSKKSKSIADSPSLSQRIRNAIGNSERQRVGKF